MKRMNLNQLAKRVAEREGGKVNLSIAQIKEVIRCTLDCLTTYENETDRNYSAVVTPNPSGTASDVYQL